MPRFLLGCVGCGVTTKYIASSLPAARELLRMSGGRVTDDGWCLCPDCAAEHRDELIGTRTMGEEEERRPA